MKYELILRYLPQLLSGTDTTIQLVVMSCLIGFLLAVPLAMMRVSDHVVIRSVPYAYIFFFRGTPLLVQIFLVYYGFSQFAVIRDSVLWSVFGNAYWCAIIAFTLNTSAYTAEIFRGSIQSVPEGEVEAARAIGMSGIRLYRRIVLPRALRLALPAYSNEVILMLKGSALASTITLLDITGTARTIIAITYRPVEIFLAAGVIYLAISFVLISSFRIVEKRVNAFLRVRNQ